MFIGAALRKLTREGKLTTNPYREKQWVASDIIHAMIKALFEDAIVNGTLSWDLVVMKSLSLLLKCVTGARAGEIHRSRLCEGIECLC